MNEKEDFWLSKTEICKPPWGSNIIVYKWIDRQGLFLQNRWRGVGEGHARDN